MTVRVLGLNIIKTVYTTPDKIVAQFCIQWHILSRVTVFGAAALIRVFREKKNKQLTLTHMGVFIYVECLVYFMSFVAISPAYDSR